MVWPIPNNPLMIDTNKLKIIAVNKLDTENPWIKWLAINTIIPLITKRKIPIVTIVIGRVSIINTGLTIAFSIVRTIATIKPTKGVETSTPGRIYATTKIDIVLIINRVRKFIQCFF